MRKLLLAILSASLVCAAPAPGQSPSPPQTQAVETAGTASLRGVVTDPSGALVPNAEILLHPAAANTPGRSATTTPEGRYDIANIAPGTYALRVTAPGFAVFESKPIRLAANRPQTLDIRLQLETQQFQMDVSPDSADATDPNKNGDALILKGKDIDQLPDNPTQLQQQLQELSGGDSPAIYVDGFSNGTIPPKDTIREIRINQNPYSARNDTDPVNGMVEIFTKPGTDKVHGDLFVVGNTSAFNTQNPYAQAQPPYYTDSLGIDFSGPIHKKASYAFNFGRFSAQTNAVVNAETLDANNNQIAFAQALPSPNTSTRFSPRLDFQLGAKSTVGLHYFVNESEQTNGGVGQLNLPGQAFDSSTTTQTLQASNSQIVSSKIVNDTRFQYVRTRTSQTPQSIAPTLLVEGAFTGGGNNSGAFHDNRDSYELQNYMAIQAGKHYFSPGVRLRVNRDANVSRAGFNGEFTFASLAAYQITQQGLASGLTPAQIAANGGGPSQFTLTAGTPAATVNVVDLGAFYQDDWKIGPRFTLSYGLRYEVQNYISERHDFAPRLGFAWGLDPKKDKPAKWVLRGGTGIFYTRLASSNILQAQRENGVSQQQYVVASPTFYPNIPAAASLGAQSSPTIYQIGPSFRSPYAFNNTLSIEHPLGKIGNAYLNYIYSRGVHTLVTPNINAPEPGTYNPAIPTSGVRPYGGTQNIFQYQSVGLGRTNRVSANVNLHAKNGSGLWAYYMLRFRNSDANGGGFPSNSYDIRADYGRIAQDLRHNLAFAVFSPMLPGRLQVASFLETNSGVPFNITVGQDLNGDSVFNDRPAFATDLTRPSVVANRFGAFDTNPIPGQRIVPINYGQGPAQFDLSVELRREFTFGPALPLPPPDPHAPTPTSKGKPYVARRFNLTFAVEADNAANFVNRAPPIGVLGSPLFGRSNALAANTADSSTAGGNANRVINLILFTRF